MKAMVCTAYGTADVLQLQEVEKPSPKDNEVLVKVHGSSINYNLLIFVTGKPFVARLMTGGLSKPGVRIAGNDLAGTVEAVGKAVKQFKPGDEVFGDTSNCGFGAFAEYAAVLENALTLKPANLSFEEAAAVPEAGLVALQGLRDRGQLQAGQKVLIYGASGGIGTFGVQIAKVLGAEVTAVCSGKNADLARSLGADHVIDYTREDFSRGNKRYDLILATAGYRSIFDYKRALSPRGIYVSTGGTMKQIFQGLLLGPLVSMTGSQKMSGMEVVSNKDLAFLTTLLEAGKVKPVIDRCYPLSAIREAVNYYAQGHTRGKIVISIGR